MNFLLKITAGKNTGSEYTLQNGKNMVGRSRSADIRVYNEDVSGKHFVVEINDNVPVLQNLSGYGTRVDGVLVHQSVELRSGQVIEAGKNLKFIFEASASENEEKNLADPEITQATKFVGDIQNDEVESAPDSGEQTSVTKFADDIEQTSVTKFADDIEQTSVTKFAADITEEQVFDESAEQTSVTRFSADIQDVADDGYGKTAAGETAPGIITEADRTAVSNINDNFNIGSINDSVNETGSFPLCAENEKTSDNTESNSFFTVAGSNDFTENSQSSNGGFDEQDMFFDDIDESEKTSSNETQIVQTRMASMDEINYIKNQIKKQQQSRMFFKFLIFSLFVVLLGVIWMLKSPPQEKILSWPQVQSGKDVRYLTASASPFQQSFADGGFDVYYPEWPNVKINEASQNVFVVDTYLGKKADVPLTVIVQKEVSDEFLYESRPNALRNALRRMAENENERFNFDNSFISEFLCPAFGQPENGILATKMAYQRDSGRSFFGILRFFRNGNCNYIVRVEVPAEEKLRALPILNSDTFLTVHPQFVKEHWEGSDEYSKGEMETVIVGVKDELQRNSPMQYPHLEREIKSILAQSLYEKNKKVYDDAKNLLADLRKKQQQWYNGQKIRWFSALRENNLSEKNKIRNDCEAVFSIVGDKRRYDILRDYWGEKNEYFQ